MTGDERGALTRRLRWRRLRLPLRAEQATRVSGMLGLGLVLGLTAILAAPRGDAAGLEVGRPAPRDVVSPRSLTFASTILTAKERQRQANAVPPIFEPTDPSVAPRQAERARRVMNMVALHRTDRLADREQKVESLLEIPELSGLDTETMRVLLAMDDELWATVRAEVPTVVAQTLRQPVRPDTEGIARTSTISHVERSLDAVTANLVASIAAQFVVANTQVDEEKTAAARDEAIESVEPAMRTIAAGQTIVRAGDIVTEEDLEALEELGLQRRRVGGREVLGMFIFSLALVSVAAAVLTQVRDDLPRHPRRVAVMVALILAFGVGARYAMADQLVLGLVFPTAAATMTVTVLLGLEYGLAVVIVLAPVVGMLAGTGLEATVYVLVGSLAGSVVLGRVERLSAFATAGVALGAANLAVVAAFRVPSTVSDLQGATELVGASLVNAALSTGLCAVGFIAAGSLFGIATSLQLLELARPDHPLLRDLQIKAPGTYHHSILLGNLAEGAAQAIGANPLMVRVGAYYHDVGKTRRPYFFVENQAEGVNPHENLDAYASARILVAHVPDGAELCHEHGIPDEVIDFVWQHHGTTRTEFFYHRAVDLLGEEMVDEDAFRYPGPRPRSREAALLMLADGSEAAVRANSPESLEDIDEVVSRIIRARLNAGQLDDSGLTLRDLKIVRRSFVDSLQSVYHPRVKYPQDVALPVGAEPAALPAPANPGPTPASDAAGGENDEHIAASVTDPEEPTPDDA